MSGFNVADLRVPPWCGVESAEIVELDGFDVQRVGYACRACGTHFLASGDGYADAVASIPGVCPWCGFDGKEE